MAFKIGSKLVIDNNQQINPNDTHNSGGFNKRNYFFNPSDGYLNDSDAYGRGVNDDSDVGFINLANVSTNTYNTLLGTDTAKSGREVGNGWKLYRANSTSGTTHTTSFDFDDLIFNGDTTYDTSLDNIHYFCFYNPHFQANYGNNNWDFRIRFTNASNTLRSSAGDYHYVQYQGLHTTSTEATSLNGGSSIALSDPLNHLVGGNSYSDFVFVEVEVHDASSSSLFTTIKWRGTTADGFRQGEGRCTHKEKHTRVTFYQGASLTSTDRKVIDDVIVAGAHVGNALYNTG